MPTPPPPPFSDFDYLEEVGRLLALTNSFATVKVGRLPVVAPEDQGLTPCAWVRPLSWSVLKEWSGTVAEEKIRELRFEVQIDSRREDAPRVRTPAGGSARAISIEDLVTAAEDAIDSQRVLDSIDELTTLDEGRYTATARSPEQTAVLAGKLGYWKVGPKEEGQGG